MIVLGIVLALLGYLTGLALLLDIGVVVVVVGLVLLACGGFGHPVGGRRFWW